VGYETQILYGPARAPGRNPLINEVALYDAVGPNTRWDFLLAPFRTAAALLPRRMITVPRSGEVMTRQIQTRAPETNAIWSARDVFNRANRRHTAFRLFTPLSPNDGTRSP